MGKIYYNGVDYSAPTISGVSGIKGNAETAYRTGNVNITPANIGLGNVNNTADSAKSVKYATTAGSATPVAHASTATTYGKSTGSNYGHTKLSDTYTSSVGDASSGVAASQKALFDAYSTLNSNLLNYFKTYNSDNNTQVIISLEVASAYLLYIDTAGVTGANGSAPRLVILRTGYDISEYYSRSIYIADANDGCTINYSNGNYIVSLNGKKFIRVGVLELIKA